MSEKTKPKVGDTVYLVKYALTQGIKPIVVKSVSEQFSFLKAIDYPYGDFSLEDWEPTMADATKTVIAMIDKKLKSIEKQKAKLEKLKVNLASTIPTERK